MVVFSIGCKCNKFFFILQKNVIFLFQNIIIFRERLKCVIVFYGIEEPFSCKIYFLFEEKNSFTGKIFSQSKEHDFYALRTSFPDALKAKKYT